MSDLNIHGYLSNEIDEYMKKIFEDDRLYSDWHKFSYDLNNFIQKWKFDLPLKKNIRESYIMTIFISELNHFQAIIILLDRHCIIESEIIIRTSLEGLILLDRLINDPEFFKQYETQNYIKRKMWYEELYTNYENDYVANAIKERHYSKDIKLLLSNQQKGFEINSIANDSQFNEYYDKYYPIFSQSTHSMPYSLQRYIDIEKDVLGYNPFVKKEHFLFLIIFNVDIMLKCIDQLCKYFNITSNEFSNLLNEFNRLNIDLKGNV